MGSEVLFVLLSDIIVEVFKHITLKAPKLVNHIYMSRVIAGRLRGVVGSNELSW